MSTNARLVLGGMVVAALVAYIAYLGAAASWQYYLLVDECAAAAEQLHDKRVRVSGRVAIDSLTIAADRSHASFLLEGITSQLPVRCAGPLPDNLTEDIEVVVEGKWRRDGHLEGDTVITRCASKYAPQDPQAPGTRR